MRGCKAKCRKFSATSRLQNSAFRQPAGIRRFARRRNTPVRRIYPTKQAPKFYPTQNLARHEPADSQNFRIRRTARTLRFRESRRSQNPRRRRNSPTGGILAAKQAKIPGTRTNGTHTGRQTGQNFVQRRTVTVAPRRNSRNRRIQAARASPPNRKKPRAKSGRRMTKSHNTDSNYYALLLVVPVLAINAKKPAPCAGFFVVIVIFGTAKAGV